ncbi:MAG: DUF2029 domain-containing protein [Deltaproteobacteria bacterium]|nr:DUF2029 domain-containing protein [Deltaproteobacteria bacterium]
MTLWPQLLVWAAAVPLWLSWPALQRSVWWYPEGGAYHVWLLGVVALVLLWRRLGARKELLWAASLAGSLSTAGLWALAKHAVVDRTAGDLLFGTLRGARRLRAGQPIYDLRGLQQSVNASPLAILAVLPLAGLSDRQAIAVFVGAAALALLLFVWAAKDIPHSKGASETFVWGVIALCACTTFFSFQRSWRLGQLDTTLLALLTVSLGWFHMEKRWRRDGSAVAFALAVGLKLAPAVAVVPLVLRAWESGAGRTRRWLLIALCTVAALGTISGVFVGWGEVGRFARNLTLVNEGTTSGNNYALRARIATWGDREARSKHAPLPGSMSWLAPLFGLLWAGWTWRARRSDPVLLMAFWLAGLPFFSPISWDIYFVWCGLLPWWLVWTRTFERGGAKVSPQSRLIWVLASGGYLLGGTMGNTVFTDFHSRVQWNTPLPQFFDEMPLVGHILTTLALAWSLQREPAQVPALTTKPDPASN